MYLVKNKKSPFYQIVYFVKGKRTTISTGKKTRKEAEKFLQKFISNHFETHLSLNEDEKDTSNISLEEFRDEYLEHLIPIKSKSYIKSIKLSFSHFTKFMGNKQLIEITVRDIDKFITYIFTRAPKASHLYYRTLKAAFSKAIAWGYLENNNFKKVKFPRIPKTLPLFITKEEFELILINTSGQKFREIFIVAFNTGMRLGELVNMKCNWIDLDNILITVKCDSSFNTKSKKERQIPMNKIVSRNSYLIK
jgi:integrase